MFTAVPFADAGQQMANSELNLGGGGAAMKMLFEKTLKILDSAFAQLEAPMPKPHVKKLSLDSAFRYEDETAYQAIILKLARVVTGLRAALLLHEHGYLQEQAAMQRILDELMEDILFLAVGLTTDEITELHKRYLRAFFQEEFDSPVSAIESSQKRDMIPRRKIQAYLARQSTGVTNQSDSIDVSRTLHSVYSGFVHAAAPQIMELYGGNPPKFHLSGMLGTPLMSEHAEDLWNPFFRGLQAFRIAAIAFHDRELEDQMVHRIDQFEQISGTSFRRDAADPK